MKISPASVRRGLGGAFATCALGGVVAATIAIPSAAAQPGCTASSFSHTASGVLANAGAWLDAHPDANNVLTAAGMQGAGAEGSVRDYFTSRPQEYALSDWQRNCNTAIQPMQIAALYQALSSGT
jgi:hemophore-related protein